MDSKRHHICRMKKFLVDVERHEHPWESVSRLFGTVQGTPVSAMLEYHNKLLTPGKKVLCQLAREGEAVSAPYIMNGQVAQRKDNTCVISFGGLLLQLDGNEDLDQFELQRHFRIGVTPV